MRRSTWIAGICSAGFLATAAQVLTHGPLTRWDDRIALHYVDNLVLHHYRHDGATLQTAELLYLVGKPWIACVLVGGLGVGLTLITRRLGPALATAVGLGVAGAGIWVFKSFFPRPSIYLHLAGSFPSGHTCVAVVSAGLVTGLVAQSSPHRNAIAMVAGGVWGMVMAWGRVALLAHWFSDVVAGWCLGMVVLVLALRIVDLTTTIGDLSPALPALRRNRS